ncbi:MAG: CaiB/BaiF CoA-transferase family protein [Bacteroidota bacterium]
MNQDQFFKGLKVIELASVLAGPAVGLFFAELGAEVMKVENRTTEGDVTRRWKVKGELAEATYSAYYCSINWNKQAYMLDLREATDRERVLDWMGEADVLISNFKAGSAVKLGMDYESLKERNPQLIYAQLTGFGEGEERPAFDIVLQAEAGFMYMTGEREGPPVRMPVALIDILAAHQLKEGILLALLHRYQSGEGSYVSVSLLEAALASLANQATNWLMAGHIPQRMGSLHPNIAPYGEVFYTLDDKPLVLAVGTEKQFVGLCKCLELEELPADERFSTNLARLQHRLALQQYLKASIRKKSRAEWMSRFHSQKVPAGEIRDMREVFEQEKAKAMILEEQMSDGRNSQRVRTVAFRVG